MKASFPSPAAVRLLLLSLLLAAAGAVPATAQMIHLRDGQTANAQGIRRDGAVVLARMQIAAGNVGEIGYDVANIVRIDFPEPPQLKLAGDLLAGGRADDAVRQLTPILAYYLPYRDIAGSWWLQLAFLQADALARQGKTDEADRFVNEISTVGGANPDCQRWVKIKQAAAIVRRGDYRPALTLLEPIVKDPLATPDSLAEAWLAIGNARLALKDYKEALLAFLHLPVYTPERALLMPAALLGSSDAYAGLDDGQRAQSALKDLIAAYPNSPEAAQAKDRLQKRVLHPPKPAGS